MAYAITRGLIVATILTIVFVPALYASWFRVRRTQPQVVLSSSPAAPQPVNYFGGSNVPDPVAAH